MWENFINSNFRSSCAFFEESILFDSQTTFLKHENIKAIVSYPMSAFWDRRWITANLTRERNLFCISWVFKFFQLSLCLQIYYTRKKSKKIENQNLSCCETLKSNKIRLLYNCCHKSSNSTFQDMLFLFATVPTTLLISLYVGLHKNIISTLKYRQKKWK